jgi:hypothetical protein
MTKTAMRSGYKFESKRSPNGQARKYQMQYDNAKYHARHVRGIEWQFTYDTWVSWWGEDITNRGPFRGQLVMARHNDTGPYHPNNVSKKTCSENCSEGNKGPTSARARIQAQRSAEKEPA